MKDTGDTQVVDWRVWKAATVAADATLPGGGRIAAGDTLYVTTETTDPKGRQVSFITPSPVALALSISIKAAREASSLRDAMTWVPTKAGNHWLESPDVPGLFNYFEQCMLSVTFAFQSLEAFANQIVSENLEGTLTIERFKEQREWTAAEIERNVSTEEKFSDILPRLGTTPSPKGRKPWEGFRKLKQLRDSTVHIKAADQYVRGEEDIKTLYFRFLSNNPQDYPRWAIGMLRYWTPAHADAWLRHAEAQFGS